MIECKEYNLAELREALNITGRQWEDRKEEVLENLKYFFDYTIKPIGKGYNIIIHRQFAEYIGISRKTDKETPAMYYQQCIIDEIAKSPKNTLTNIANVIVSSGKNKYNISREAIVAYGHTIIKPFGEGEWMRLDEKTLSYIPLSAEELDVFKKAQDECDRSEDLFNIMTLYKKRRCTKPQAEKAIFDICEQQDNKALALTRERLGFTPEFVSLLGIKTSE